MDGQGFSDMRKHHGGALQVAPSHKRKAWVRFGSFRFYLILFVVAAGLHFLTSVLDSTSAIVPVPDKDVALEFQKKQLDTWAEMNKLLIALATATMGAVGGFLLNLDRNNPIPSGQRRRAAASWVFCSLSLYFGYLSYHEATDLLSHGAFNAYVPRLWWPVRGQFWSFLISVVIFADFVYGSVRDKNENASRNPEEI